MFYMEYAAQNLKVGLRPRYCGIAVLRDKPQDGVADVGLGIGVDGFGVQAKQGPRGGGVLVESLRAVRGREGEPVEIGALELS